MPFARGDIIDDYSLLEPIGGGKDGQVWLVRHLNGSGPREVAIKFFRNSGPDDMKRINLEFETLRRAHHECIPRVYGDGIKWHDRVPYMVMDYAGPKTLAERIASEKCIPVRQALGLAAQVADALDACHSSGIVHRDVKPLNIRIRHSGTSGDHAMLVDFGIVKKHDLNITTAGDIVGTPNYMSPEQVKGERLDSRSDQYSLAISLWEMLTGCVTFKAKTPWEVMRMHVETPPGPLRITSLDPADPLYASIDFALRKALSKDREARFSSCTEFIRAAGMTGQPEAEVGVCAASGMLPGPNCREKRRVTGSQALRQTCRRCRPPGLIRVEVCRVSSLLPGPYCTKRPQRFARGQEPADVCDRCEPKPVPPPRPSPARGAVMVKVCEKTGLRAGSGCRKTVRQKFQREQVPKMCRECKGQALGAPVLAGVGLVVVFLVVIAIAIGSRPVKPTELRPPPPVNEGASVQQTGPIKPSYADSVTKPLDDLKSQNSYESYRQAIPLLKKLDANDPRRLEYLKWAEGKANTRLDSDYDAKRWNDARRDGYELNAWLKIALETPGLGAEEGARITRMQAELRTYMSQVPGGSD